MFKSIRLIVAIIIITNLLGQPLQIEARENTPVALTTLYSMVPTVIRDTFEQEGWTIQVMDSRTLAGRYAPGLGEQYALAGATVFADSTIYLSDMGNLAEQSINHELGHYFDDAFEKRFGYLPSETQQFIEIFNNEAYTSSLMQSYMVSTPAEYFAQSFKYYCEGNMEFMQAYPNTYFYIANTISDFENYTYVNYL